MQRVSFWGAEEEIRSPLKPRRQPAEVSDFWTKSGKPLLPSLFGDIVAGLSAKARAAFIAALYKYGKNRAMRMFGFA